MVSSPPIEVENLSKSYRLWREPIGRLWSHLLENAAAELPARSRWPGRFQAASARHYREFHALHPLSFTVGRGESVGIIGVNGSGKSTLLQLISGTLSPSSGTVRLNGRVAALLELGSGFSPEFTGRENVFLNAAILGLSQAETEARFADIEAFADIGEFIDQPVKTYSSGMQLRLAFAVAISVDPQILIVDEALSVGDIFFQQKCFARIREMLARGTTLLLVSHDLAAVQNLCTRALFLDQGRLVYMGAPEECASRFYARMAHTGPAATSATATPAEGGFADELLHRAKARHGDRALELLAARVTDEKGVTTLQTALRGTLQIQLLVRANRNVGLPACGIHLFDRMNNLVFASGTQQVGQPMKPLQAGQQRLITFEIKFSVHPGLYTFNLAVGEPVSAHSNQGAFHDVCEGLGPLEVLEPTQEPWPFYGIAELATKIEVHDA